MKILAVILFLGIMLSSCGNKADSERLNDSAFTTTAESSVVDSDSMEVDESSQVGDESDIQGDSPEDDMKWRLFEDTYKETDSGRAAENYAHNKGIKIDGFVKYGQENPPVCDLILGETRFAGVGCEVIAAYNYLTYEGFEPDMAKLAYDFEKNALIAADGSLGSNPRKISGLFKAMGVGYKRFYKAETVPTVFVHQCERGRSNLVAKPHANGDPPGNSSLSCTKTTAVSDKISAFQPSAYLLTQSDSFRRR